MTVVYCPRTPKTAIAPKDAEHVDFKTLLEVSDFVSIHAPLTQETRGVFDAKAFAAMKSTAVFVNTGRGEIHDQAALADALRQGQLFSAGLDVTAPEPIEKNDPCCLCPTASCFLTLEARPFRAAMPWLTLPRRICFLV